MKDRMYVDLWSDVVCPFCYLGSHHLSEALGTFAHADRVTVRRHAFELDPRAELNTGAPLAEILARKYSISVERALELNDRVERQARELGMQWSLDRARPTNTLDAHRLIAFAATQVLGEQMSERLFTAYFSEGELVSDHFLLDRLAEQVGVVGTDRLWLSDAYVSSVRQDEQAAEELGISGVPSFLVDGTFMLAGAQGADQVLRVLERAWNRREAQSSDSAGTTAAVATE